MVMPDYDETLLQQLRDLLGDGGLRIEHDDVMPDVILRPQTIEEVSGILRLCSAAAQPLVPLGGKTGLANGHVQTGVEFGLSLERLRSRVCCCRWILAPAVRLRWAASRQPMPVVTG